MAHKPEYQDRTYEVRITNVSSQVALQLRNIASYIGVDVSHMLRPVLREFIESKPLHWRCTDARRDDDVSTVIKDLREIADHTGIPIRELIKPIIEVHGK